MSKTPVYVGQAVLHSDRANYRFGVIGVVDEVKRKASIAWLQDGKPHDVSRDLSLGIVEDYAKAAEQYQVPARSVAETSEIMREAYVAWDHRKRQTEEALQKRLADAEAFQVELKERAPDWAKAVLVAELNENVSDSQSDYYGSKVNRVLILAWSKHTRDIFSEMRKAAHNAPETASLADAPKEAEYREKWSMGGGYFLSSGDRYSGWKVRKYDLSYQVPQGEWRIP